MSFWILTDVCSDLPRSYIDAQEQFSVMPMPYRLDHQESLYAAGDEAAIAALYQAMHAGIAVATSQIGVADYVAAFRRIIAAGGDLLYISLSSGLSGSYQSALLARAMLLEEYPRAQIEVVDSLCASLGQGLLVHHALARRGEGNSLADTARWVQTNRYHLLQWFTVADLDFLYRGGRVSRTAALFGGMLQIKPILHVNNEGKLIPVEKVQGRRRSLKTLADKAIALAEPREGQAIFISHGDCLEDAQYVEGLIRQGLPQTKEFLLAPIGAVIGAHSGPGTVALFFLGSHR